MPSHRIHRLIDKLFLGEEFPEVHRFMDKPYIILGRKHRILFHDPLTVAFLGILNPKYGASALLHILADRGESEIKKMLRKKYRRKRKRKH